MEDITYTKGIYSATALHQTTFLAVGSLMMEDITYTKGIYSATASVKQVGSDSWKGAVTLSRDDGDTSSSPETTQYEVDTSSSTPEEAFEEAKALAHRILGEIEL